MLPRHPYRKNGTGQRAKSDIKRNKKDLKRKWTMVAGLATLKLPVFKQI